MSVDVEFVDQSATIRLNRQPSNILDFEMMDELSAVLSQVAEAPLLILTSALEHFSFGVDVKIHTPEQSGAMLSKFHEIIRKLYHHRGITVSVINGYALGGGMELSLVCDFIFAHKDSVVGFPEIRLACFSPVASVLLPRKIGGKASKYLYTGKVIHADAAEQIGMIEGVFAEEPSEYLETIRRHSLSAMSILKRVLRKTSGYDFDADLAKAEELYLNGLVQCSDMLEGVQAFLEERTPNFKQ